MKHKRIRLGILTQGDNIPFWSYDLIQSLLDSKKFEIAHLRLETPQPNKEKFVLKLYMAFERKVFGRLKNASRMVSLDGLPKNALEKLLLGKGDMDSLPKKVSDLKLDVLINLGQVAFEKSPAQKLNTAVWSTVIGASSINTSSIVCAKEMLTNQETMGANLICHTGENVFDLFNTRTSVDKMSILRSSNNALWLLSRICYRELDKLHALGSEDYYASKERIQNGHRSGDHENESFPGNGKIIFLLIGKYLNKLKALIESILYFPQWVLCYSFDSKDMPAHEVDLSKTHKLIPPRDRFWADPFVFEKDGHYHVFFEELIYKNIKGHLSTFKIGKDGSHTEPVRILEKPYHLSYPFVFEDGNHIYMVPETSENRTIELYRSEKFPEKWKFVGNIMEDIDAVDTTIFFKDGRYWMFTNVRERHGYSKNNELFLFSSDNLLSGQWEAHPNNPIVSDATKARSAGQVYMKDGRMFRPSQNCGKSYGYGIMINEILVINPKEYREKTIMTIDPTWSNSILCTHSINKENNLTLIDALYKRRRV